MYVVNERSSTFQKNKTNGPSAMAKEGVMWFSKCSLISGLLVMAIDVTDGVAHADGAGAQVNRADVFYNWYTGGPRGAEQGTHGTGMGDCPQGHVVVGLQYFEGGNSDWVDGIGVHCQSLSDVGGLLWNWYGGGARGAEQGTHGTGMGDCPFGQVVVGIQYFEGGNSDWVDGIGVHCKSLLGSAGLFWNWYSGGARGAEQGTHGSGLGECPSGQIVVGVQYFEGGNSDWVDGVGMHCRDSF